MLDQPPGDWRGKTGPITREIQKIFYNVIRVKHPMQSSQFSGLIWNGGPFEHGLNGGLGPSTLPGIHFPGKVNLREYPVGKIQLKIG